MNTDLLSAPDRRLLTPANVAGCVLLGVIYALLGHISLQFSFVHPQVSTVWAPSGVALAALLLQGPRLLPGVALGAFALNAWTSGSIATGLGIALGSSLSALAGYALLTRIAQIDNRLPRLRDVMAIVVAGAAASPVLAALIGPLTLWLAGSLPAADLAKAGLLWWLGDSLGILVFTPLILAWRVRPAGSDRRDWQAVGVLIAQVITALIVFHGLLAEPLNIERSTYALLPYAVWLALVYPLRYTAASNLLLFLIAVFETAGGLGPFAGDNAAENLLLLHLFLSIVVFTTLVVAGINAERLATISQTKANADRYRKLAELSADWYWEQDENLRFISVGESREFQAPDVALQIGRTRWEIPHAGVSPEQRQAIDKLVAERKPFRDLVMTRFKADGKPRIISTSGYPIFDEQGRFRGYRGIGRDITDLKLAENALRESETRFRSLIDLSSDWYWEQGPDLKFTFISGAHQDRAGVTGEESIGKTRFELDNQFESDEARRQHETDLAARRPFRDLILKRIRPDGQVRYAAVSGRPIFDADGTFSGYRGVGRDVTTLKLTEQALRESEERLRRQIQSMPVACIILDENLLITGWNPAAKRIFGFDAEEIIGRSPYETLIPPGAQTEVAQRIAALEAGQPSVGGLNDNLTRDGRTILCRWQNVALTNSAGATIGYLAMAEDVTAMTAAERTIRESEERFRTLTELSSDWYWEQDSELRFTFTSNAVDQISGIPGNMRTGKRRWEIDGLEFDPVALEEHKRLLAQRKPFRDFRYTRIRADGQVRYISVTGTPLFDAAGRFAGYRGVGKDVTAEVQAERRVARLRDFYAALSKTNEAIIHATDARQLFDRACEIAVTHGHVIFARICLINAETSMLENVAIAGDHHGYPDKAPISLDPAHPQAHGPTAIALRTGQPDICNDIEADPRNLLWRPAMMATGARAYAVYPLQRNGAVVGSFHIYAADRNWFDDELAALLAELVANLSFALDNFERERARQNAEDALKQSEERFRGLTEISNDWYWEQDREYRVTYMSPRYSARDGMMMKPSLGQTRFETDNIWESDEIRRAHRAALDARQPFRDLRLARRNEIGEMHYMLISGRPVFDSDGQFAGYRGVGKDITAERVAEIRSARLKDFYAALSEVNNAIIHAGDRDQLFEDVCKAIIEHGHLQFVRVAILDPATRLVRTVAHGGEDFGLAQRLYFSMDPDVREGSAPSAAALRAGKSFVCNNIVVDGQSILWRDLLIDAGLQSVATFPLHIHGNPAGALHLYALDPGFFDAELVSLMERLAHNVSFALDNFERETARQQAERALRASEQRFRDVAEAAGEFVWENNLQGHFTYVSPKVSEYTGYTPAELLGRTAAEFMPPGEAERVRQWLVEHMKPDRSFRNMEHQFVTRSGETLWMSVSAVSIWDDQGRPLGQRGTTRDITALKQSEARISYLATRDPLTELPNRLLFNDRLEQGIINSRRKGEDLAVLFIDLDRFKNINDSLGHHIGDLLLKEVSSRMVACIRKGDTVSRLGGDEFVVTLEGLAHAEDAANVARKITQALTRPFDIGGHTLNTSCSIGISIFPNDAEDSRELMKNADTAMYHAKEQGRNNFQFFSPEMNTHAVERHRLETELRQALAANQFLLHYQPQFDLKTDELIGMEALIRWQHPQRGLVPPASFIPVAEESGLIEPIGQWALREACIQNRKWQEAGMPAVKVAVNISARQFNDPKGFARDVTRLLHASGLEPRYLELEMTESMLLKNVDENIAVLRRLGEQGTRMAVDDFGTGYSSLAYLKQLPIDTLKIDRTFVNDIETDPDDAAIIQAIIAMAHSLDLRVTAEGVENKGQLEALRRLGCDEYQGYLISRPLPAAEFAERFLLGRRPARHRSGAGASAPAPASRRRARRG